MLHPLKDILESYANILVIISTKMSNEWSVGRVILDANWYLQAIIVRGKRPLEIHNARNVQYKIPFRDVDKTIRLF